MMSNKQKLKQIFSIFVLIIGFISPIIFFFLSNVITAIIPQLEIKELVVLLLILVGIGIICWFCISLVCFLISRSMKNLDFLKIDKLIKEDSLGFSKCELSNNNVCCLSTLVNQSEIDIKIPEHVKKANRLYSVEEMEDIEDVNKNKTKWKTIWIFSENLKTELDENNNLETIVISNIKNAGVVYTEFYLCRNENEQYEINERKEAMINSLGKGKSKDNLKFFQIDIENGYIGNNTIPLLCGSILFSTRNDIYNYPIFSEGYLSIRKSYDDQPIYYKMPPCMLKEYSEYFKKN